MLSAAEIQAQDRLWTVKEVAHYLAKGKSWVYEQVKAMDRPLPCFKVGAELRFDPEAVKRWLRGEPEPVKPIVSLVKK